MSQFFLQQPTSTELLPFPHIAELACQKIQHIQLNSFVPAPVNELQVFYINEGKFEWLINGKQFVLYAGDTAVILPRQQLGSEKGFLDLGTLSSIKILPQKFTNNGLLTLGKWSSIPETESNSIGKLLLLNDVSVLSRLSQAGHIFQCLQKEIAEQEIGYTIRVNQLIDELLIVIVRHLTRQNNLQRDFPQTFMKLEQSLRSNLDHQWLVEEMAVLVGLGTTAFTEKVKSYTGFSPMHYLINIRIAEAIKMLKNTDKPVTDIALETGFYSSQHFATTFKKLTGYTPRQFRVNNTKKSDLS
ncbi:MAG: AraC family transcriptional regulator [Chitinophagaceae bacterium]